MSIQKYKAFLHTVERGSISRAAEDLGYTQSAVSRMILDLEQDWGVTLLRRSRGGLSLSSDGQVLLPQISKICRETEALETKVREIHGLEAGLLRIGACSGVSSSFLPSLIRAFQSQYPKVEFQLRNGAYSEIAQWLRRGEIDCGFLQAPFPDDATATVLMRDRLMAVLPAAHPLATAQAFPLWQLANERFIMAREDRDREIAGILQQVGEPVRIAYEASDGLAALAMVEAGLGVSILPEHAIRRMTYHVAALDFDPRQSREIGVAVTKDGNLSAAVRLFVELAGQTLKGGALYEVGIPG